MKKTKKVLGILVFTFLLSLTFAVFSFASKSGPLVSNIKASATSSTATLSWTYKEENEGYNVYQFDKENQAYYLVATQKEASYTATNLSPATEYSFAVSVLTKQSKTVVQGPIKVYNFTTGVDQVKNLKLNASESADTYSTLTWSKVKGAKGYEIYYYNTTKKQYLLLGSKETTSAKVTNLKGGTQYKYKIRAYCLNSKGDKIYGKFSSVLSVVTNLSKPTELKYTSNSNSITLTWKSVPGAQGYKVYVYNSTTKKYSTAATVTTEKCVLKSITDGTIKKVKIKAFTKYDKTYYSADSSVLTCATKPLATKVSQVTDALRNGKVSLKWTKVSRCDGYLVYISTSKNGTYKLKKKIGGNSNNSCILTSISNGKTFYVKVIPYRNVSGKAVNAANSNIISVRA